MIIHFNLKILFVNTQLVNKKETKKKRNRVTLVASDYAFEYIYIYIYIYIYKCITRS